MALPTFTDPLAAGADAATIVTTVNDLIAKLKTTGVLS